MCSKILKTVTELCGVQECLDKKQRGITWKLGKKENILARGTLALPNTHLTKIA